MMSLRIYWQSGSSRSGMARRCVAELVIAAALVAPACALAKEPEPDPAGRVTAREAIERQFAAPAAHTHALSGAEAARIIEKYHTRIGKMLEPKREIGGGRAER